MRFVQQFHNVLVYILLGAGFAKMLVGLWLDAAVILGVVLINGLLGFLQEGKAEKALDSIRTMLSAEARCTRGGDVRLIPAEDLVPGDVVLLEREGVSVRAVSTDATTRRSVTVWVSSTREHFRILVEGDPLAERAWRECLDAVGELDKPDFVVLSGALPPAVPAAVVTAFAEGARSLGSRFVCDTSGPGLVAAVAAGADLVKPSVSRAARSRCGRGIAEGV